MMQVHRFDFTPAGGAHRRQQVHEASHKFVQDDRGASCLHIWIESTRPGETLDDCGVPGWDSSVILNLVTGPIQMPDPGAGLVRMPDVIAGCSPADSFLYYWDHADLVAARMTAKWAERGWDITFDGQCEEGNAVRFTAFLPR